MKKKESHFTPFIVLGVVFWMALLTLQAGLDLLLIQRCGDLNRRLENIEKRMAEDAVWNSPLDGVAQKEFEQAWLK